MSIELKVGVTREDVTRHFIRLNDEQMKDILTRAVAEASGVDLSAAGVRVGKFFITRQAGISGTECRVEIEIIEDHEAARRHVEMSEVADIFKVVFGGIEAEGREE